MILRLFSFSLIFLSVFSGITPSTDARTYYKGSKGGCYYLSSSGNKVYVSHHYCNRDDEGTAGIYNKKTKKTYYTGPKGGCFYYGSNYKKLYVNKSYCGRY